MSLQDLIATLNPVKGVISRLNFEAYCDNNGYLDAPYISHVLGNKRINQSGLNAQVNTAVGAAAFMPSDELVELVTEAEFREIYKFGEVPVVRDYILLAHELLGKVLTRENLFLWVLQDSKTKKY